MFHVVSAKTGSCARTSHFAVCLLLVNTTCCLVSRGFWSAAGYHCRVLRQMGAEPILVYSVKFLRLSAESSCHGMLCVCVLSTLGHSLDCEKLHGIALPLR